jgi:hypothetical protein
LRPILFVVPPELLETKQILSRRRFDWNGNVFLGQMLEEIDKEITTA